MGSGLLKTIVLGIIQGLTEFLPVSSSGHLELAKYFLDSKLEAEQSLMVTIILHFATALSTAFVFRKDILMLFKGLLNRGMNDEKKFFVYIILSMIPATIIGVFFIDKIEWFFSDNILLVAIMLWITGLLLIISDKKRATTQGLRCSKAMVIGFAQAIATVPGISRSGSTIATSLLLNVKREEAAKFSFLMVIPLIFGKICLDLFGGDYIDSSIDWGQLFFGFITAFITGVIACRWMIKLVNRSKLRYFAYYCFLLGSITILIVILDGSGG